MANHDLRSVKLALVSAAAWEDKFGQILCHLLDSLVLLDLIPASSRETCGSGGRLLTVYNPAVVCVGPVHLLSGWKHYSGLEDAENDLYDCDGIRGHPRFPS